MTFFITKKAAERKSSLRIVLHSGIDCPLIKGNHLPCEMVAISEDVILELNQKKCTYCFG